MSLWSRSRVAQCDATLERHDVDSQAQSIRRRTTEVNGMTMVQKSLLERGDRNRFGLKIVEGATKNFEIFPLSEDRKVRIAAKFRCAVQNAGLSTHEKAVHPMLTHR